MNKIAFCDGHYLVHDNETVLEGLLRQGATVAYSCRKGSCRTCVLKCDEGELQHDRPVDPELWRERHFLPCVAHACSDLRLSPPDFSRLSVAAEIVARRELGGGVFEIAVAPVKELDYRAGQHVQLVREDGLGRPYSLTSRAGADYYFTVHVRLHPQGAMSRWLCLEAPVGQRLSLLPPQGDCCWDRALMQRPRLVLLATGSGGGALLGIAQQALAEGYVGAIHLYHGAREPSGLYLHDSLRELSARHANFHYVPCVSGTTDAGLRPGRVVQALLDDGIALDGAEVFLCGNPAMVDEARFRIVLAGGERGQIHADPFDAASPTLPRDGEKLAALRPDPELWAALEQGPGLRRLLENFYSRVYADERLLPYFQGIPKTHVVSKQYEFLAMVWSGETQYLGLNPFNAHHWMVISHDLFDHREELFAAAMLAVGLPAWARRRIQALHEFFRTDIVKSAARGMVVQGAEQPVRVHQVTQLDIDAVCDGCGAEIPAGAPSRYHYRIGTLHCATCAAL